MGKPRVLVTACYLGQKVPNPKRKTPVDHGGENEEPSQTE